MIFWIETFNKAWWTQVFRLLLEKIGILSSIISNLLNFWLKNWKFLFSAILPGRSHILSKFNWILTYFCYFLRCITCILLIYWKVGIFSLFYYNWTKISKFSLRTHQIPQNEARFIQSFDSWCKKLYCYSKYGVFKGGSILTPPWGIE